MHPVRQVEEGNGELSEHALNKRAGDALMEARKLLGHKQISFAPLLSKALGFEIQENRLGKWERGERTVPAVVLLAAADLAKASVGDLMLSRGELMDQVREFRDRLDRLEQKGNSDV